jgi:hypothetical protein
MTVFRVLARAYLGKSGFILLVNSSPNMYNINLESQVSKHNSRDSALMLNITISSQNMGLELALQPCVTSECILRLSPSKAALEEGVSLSKLPTTNPVPVYSFFTVQLGSAYIYLWRQFSGSSSKWTSRFMGNLELSGRFLWSWAIRGSAKQRSVERTLQLRLRLRNPLTMDRHATISYRQGANSGKNDIELWITCRD